MEAAQELWPKLGMFVEKNMRRADRPRRQRIDRDDLAFPFWIQQIPIGFDLGWIDQLGVIGDLAAARRAFENENITILRVIVMMLAFIPSGKIENIGQEQQRLHRLQTFGAVKYRQRRNVP